jgi:hypothetical protein
MSDGMMWFGIVVAVFVAYLCGYFRAKIIMQRRIVIYDKTIKRLEGDTR